MMDTYKDIERVEVKARDEGVQGVQVSHPMANILGKLDSFLQINLDLCRIEQIPSQPIKFLTCQLIPPPP